MRAVDLEHVTQSFVPPFLQFPHLKNVDGSCTSWYYCETLSFLSPIEHEFRVGVSITAEPHSGSCSLASILAALRVHLFLSPFLPGC